MTATTILENLASEFSVKPESVQAVFEMVDAGLSAPFIGRFRRGKTDALTESQIRRLQNRRVELEELDRRRGTILRTLERVEGIDESALDAIRKCMDRFELEDLYVPHRRPEPEVQLALDRGLGALADLLVKAVPREQRAQDPEKRSDARDPVETPSAGGDGAPPDASPEGSASTEGSEAAPSVPDTAAEAAVESTPETAAEVPTPPGAESPEATDPSSTATPEGETAPPAAANEAEAKVEAPPEAPPGVEPASAADESKAAPPVAVDLPANGPPVTISAANLPGRIPVTLELARLCQPFVHPDRGIHTDVEALAGAVRILSDRLGRNSHLRGLIRRILRKRGNLRVRALVDDSKAGRHKPLLKINHPLRQIQGHRLIAIRQAAKERVLNTTLHLDRDIALPKVRAAFGRHTSAAHEDILREVSRQALEARLMPVVEADVRLELKERGDSEALRFLSQHLRQILLTPPLGQHTAMGVDVNAKGDWTVCAVRADGTPASSTRIEVGEKDEATLGAELKALIEPENVRVLAVGNGRGPRAALQKIRGALRAVGIEAPATIVDEAGLSSYANSELARRELSDSTVPERMAISLARRLQDPMAEILKVDPRHLGLGSEQGLVSKANARRVFTETVESCVAHIGCDVNTAPQAVLENMPGLDAAVAKRLIEARQVKRFNNREELRAEGLLTEAQWTSSVAFLRISGGDSPLDRTSLHPENYALAQQLLENAGSSIDDGLGRPGVTKGLRRANYQIDEATWRDLIRELSHPGRDPRPRLDRPELLDPATDLTRLLPGRAVDGIVTNVASFGAFVDIGLKNDAMIHISEIADHYVRDARELLSIGEVIRARIIDPKGQRMSLSLKNVPRRREPARQGRPQGQHRDAHSSQPPRGDKRGRISDGRGGRGGGRGGPSRGGPGGRGRRDDRGGVRMDRDDRAKLEKINANSNKAAAYNPFAAFFKSDDSEPDTSAVQTPQAAPRKPKPEQPKPEQAQAPESPQAAQEPQVVEPPAPVQATGETAPSEGAPQTPEKAEQES